MDTEKIMIVAPLIIILGVLWFATDQITSLSAMGSLPLNIASAPPVVLDNTEYMGAIGSAVKCSLKAGMKYGTSGTPVKNLQAVLIQEGLLTSAVLNPAPGMGVSTGEAGKFLDNTASAVVAFQEKYKADILAVHTPIALEHGTGYVDDLTAKKLNDVCMSAPAGEKKCYASGDINGDGKTDSQDKSLVTQYINGTKKLADFQIARGDMDADGKLTNSDIAIMNKVIAGKSADESGIAAIPCIAKPQCFPAGDVNYSGVFDKEDFTLIQKKFLLGTKLDADQQKLLDFDANGTIDMKDYTLIQQANNGNTSGIKLSPVCYY